MMQEVSQENILRTVEKYNVRSIFSFPTYLTGLVKHPSSSKYNLQSLRFAFTAGMVVGPMFFQCLQALKLTSIVTIYGMTEVGFLTANVEWHEIDGKITAALGGMNFSGGRLPPGASLRIQDIETGVFLGPGQRGELCFKNDLVCPGYWKNEEASQLTFRDGWISTGDLGYYDDDGNIYVLNRVKEVFKYYNNHITPSDLENTLLQHPSIEEACVVGVSDPAGGGTIPRAYVKLRNPAGDCIGTNEILCWANGKFPDYKKLRGGLYILESFPKGKSGKILRNALTISGSTIVNSQTIPPQFTTPLSD